MLTIPSTTVLQPVQSIRSKQKSIQFIPLCHVISLKERLYQDSLCSIPEIILTELDSCSTPLPRPLRPASRRVHVWFTASRGRTSRRRGRTSVQASLGTRRATPPTSKRFVIAGRPLVASMNCSCARHPVERGCPGGPAVGASRVEGRGKGKISLLFY